MSRFGNFLEDLIPANEEDAAASNLISPNPFGMDAIYGTNLFTGKPGDPPSPPPPGKDDSLLTAMPSLTDSDRRTAARKAAASLRKRGGRASTILTDDYLGGGL